MQMERSWELTMPILPSLAKLAATEKVPLIDWINKKRDYCSNLVKIIQNGYSFFQLPIRRAPQLSQWQR